VTSVIPHPNHWLGKGMFITQRTHAGRAQQEVSSGPRLKPHPSGGEHPQEVAARKKEHSRSGGSHPGQYEVSPHAHLVRRFTARATVAEQLPLRSRSKDLVCAETLVLTVVPFDQIAIDFGNCPEPGQLTCPYRALQWARKHLPEIQSSQSFSQCAGVLLAALRQWKIGKPRMLTRQAPRGLAVPGQINNRKLVADGSVLVGRALAASVNRVQPSSRNAIRRRRRRSLTDRVKKGLSLNGWSPHSALQQEAEPSQAYRVPLDDFAVGERLSIQRFVTGVIGFQDRTIEAEACEGSLVIVKMRKKSAYVPGHDFGLPLLMSITREL
jgi:hypothetical protein